MRKIDEEFEEMGTSKLEYYCSRCCLTSDRVFNFQASLSRLSAGANDRNGLKSAAMVESICLRNDPVMRADDTPDYSGLKLDSYALNVLKDCGGGNVGRRPLHVSGDGNCLFNSVSVLLSGTRVMATELRVRCCVELVLNEKLYQRAHDAKELYLGSPSFDEECAQVLINGKWVSMWSMHAVASVIGKRIRSVFPCMNGVRLTPLLNTSTRFLPERIRVTPRLRRSCGRVLMA